MKVFISLLLCIFLWCINSNAQVYLEKQTRHRFAQLNLGLDIESNFGGFTKYLNESGNISTLNLTPTYKPRFIIGGTHFWGHADFHIAIPLFNPTIEEDKQEISMGRGVETVLKYYPWRIQSNKIRPYLGISLTPIYFTHNNDYLEDGNGPDLNYMKLPLIGGFTYNKKNHLIELGFSWNYDNKENYYISPTIEETIKTSTFYTTLSYKYILETTLGAEKDWESGRSSEVTDFLAAKNKLNSFYFGIGLSAAFWLKPSDYNKINRPYVQKYNDSIFPEFSLGYYLHKSDLNIGMAYRGYGTSVLTYEAFQKLKRKSLAFELSKYLFDYHGFVPFIGPTLSYENLAFREVFNQETTHDTSDSKFAFGINFGWDIRPNRIQTWILRTNLRWFPSLNLELSDQSTVSFDNIEFNFIQLIIYPGRMF